MPEAASGIAARRLDLYDIGAEVSQDLSAEKSQLVG
jgi:hypothetical protein